MTLPNYITIARFFAIPFVLYFMLSGQMMAAFVLFLLAGLSDAIDGALARQFKLHSKLGAWLDPMADKMLLVSVYVALAVLGLLPVWLVILVVARDLSIGAGVLASYALKRPVAIAPLFVSKLNTTSQILLAVAALGDPAILPLPDPVIPAMIWLTAGLTVASFASYFLVWTKTVTAADRV